MSRWEEEGGGGRGEGGSSEGRWEEEGGGREDRRRGEGEWKGEEITFLGYYRTKFLK